MSLSSWVSLAGVLASAAPALAHIHPASKFAARGLDKPVVYNSELGPPLDAYWGAITPTSSSRVDIPAPQMCIDRAADKCTAEQIQAVAVTYDDCEVPWVLCRCDDSEMSMDSLVDRFGSLKVGVRDYVGAALAVQGDGHSAGSSGDFIVFNGDTAAWIFQHEAGHSVDQGVNGSPEWQAVIDQSSCVPDPYANTSPAELFAQMMVCTEYVRNLGPLPGDASCLQPLVDFVNGTQRVLEAMTRQTCDVTRRPFNLYEDAPAPEDPPVDQEPTDPPVDEEPPVDQEPTDPPVDEEPLPGDEPTTPEDPTNPPIDEPPVDQEPTDPPVDEEPLPGDEPTTPEDPTNPPVDEPPVDEEPPVDQEPTDPPVDEEPLPGDEPTTPEQPTCPVGKVRRSEKLRRRRLAARRQ